MPTPSAERLLPLHEADLAACRTLLKTGSRSFFAAAHFLPYRCRDAATALYAFCRQADDAVDESGAPAEALAVLHARLDALYAGTPQNYPADRALAAVAQRCGLPKTLLEALLEGFAWDAEGRAYDDLEGVLSYSARVAGAVGVMMAVLMGERDADVLARAADMGVAMQLTNISRDVGEDARNGRLYLPREWLREAGIDPEAFLAEPRHSEGLAEVLARLLAVAHTLYRRADSGLTRLPSRCRPGMYAARLLYSAIGEQLAARGVMQPGEELLLNLGEGLLKLVQLVRRVLVVHEQPVVELEGVVLGVVYEVKEGIEPFGVDWPLLQPHSPEHPPHGVGDEL